MAKINSCQRCNHINILFDLDAKDFVLLNISLRRINRGGWADEGVILMDSCSCRERRLISFDAELREKTGAESG